MKDCKRIYLSLTLKRERTSRVYISSYYSNPTIQQSKRKNGVVVRSREGCKVCTRKQSG